jgi:site-specific recombinase XerD
LAAAEKFSSMATAFNTDRAFRSDWKDFEKWCRAQRLASYPAEPSSVGLYIAHLAQQGRKISTAQRRLTAINWYHRNRDGRLYAPASLKYAAVAQVMKGLKRERGIRPDQKEALSTGQLRAMVVALPDTLHSLRDRALLLIGFAGGFRRSELVALKVEDIEVTEDGLKVLIRRGKADWEGEGRTVGIPHGSDPRTNPIRAYKAWITAAGITSGPVFRAFRNQTMMASGISSQVVALIVKQAAERVGLDARDFSGHSLRSGLATQAAREGASERSIMAQTGHKSVQMVRRYIREGSLFHDNAAAKLGL